MGDNMENLKIYEIENSYADKILKNAKSLYEYKMKNNMDFLKVGNYAVINLNNMFPVPKSQCIYVDISKESNPSYKALLSAEYRIITSLAERILKNAKSLYEYKMKNSNTTPLAKRCNDFKLLEEKCKEYSDVRKK